MTRRYQTPVFLSDNEAQSLEAREEVLAIGVGTSIFGNEPPKDPWEIDSSIRGITPYDLWFGLSRVSGKSLARQFELGRELVLWICDQIERNGLDPFGAFPQPLPALFEEYSAARRVYSGQYAVQGDRADVYLINSLYFVAVQVSCDPGVLSSQYGLLPHNRIDYSVVYNPDWGKTSIGANTLGPMPQGSAAMLVYRNLDSARARYQATGKVYLPVALNLDNLTAAMLAMGDDLPLVWVKYVEALKLGNFSGRINKRLPDLIPVGENLSKLDRTKGKWGGSPTFQGSARGEKTAITNLEQVLMAMAEVFPKLYEGAAPEVRLIKSGS